MPRHLRTDCSLASDGAILKLRIPGNIELSTISDLRVESWSSAMIACHWRDPWRRGIIYASHGAEEWESDAYRRFFMAFSRSGIFTFRVTDAWGFARECSDAGSPA